MIATDYIFGRSSPAGEVTVEPNLLVNCSPITVEELASKLGILVSDISFFEAVGNEHRAIIDVDYTFNSSFTLSNWAGITSFIDKERCKGMPPTSYIGTNSGTNIQVVELWQCVNHGKPSINFTYDGRPFKIRRIYMPKALQWGDTTANENIFWTNHNYPQLTVYAHASMETINAGAPEGDLAHVASRGAKVVYIQNEIKPNTPALSTIGNIYGTAVQLIDNGTNNNQIDFFEVKVNGVLYGEVSAGGIIANLNPSTLYSIEAIAVDIYYNKSAAGTIQVTTAAADPYPVSNIVAYLQMENSEVDLMRKLLPKAYNISSYVPGLVGQAVSLNGTSGYVNLNSNTVIGGKTAFTIIIPFKDLVKSNNVLYSGWSSVLKVLIRINTGQIQYYTYTTAQAGGNFFAFNDAVDFHILECSYDGTTMRAYLDGVESATSYAQTGAIATGGEVEYIGKQSGAYGKAIIDDFMILDTVLTVPQRAYINNRINTGQHLL